MEYIKKIILPEFPRTKHLSSLSKATSDDLLASDEEFSKFMSSKIYVFEKVDGANCGVTFFNDELVVRNRKHVLNKNYSKTDTPAKKQFVHLWTWAYENKDKFKYLEKRLGYMPSLYGEWLYACHTIPYDKLPDYLLPFDIWNPNERKFVETFMAYDLLLDAGFHPPTMLAELGPGHLEEYVSEFMSGVSAYSTSQIREGLYLKNKDGDRYKIVNSWFEPNDEWIHEKEITKNKKV
jgi:hypothetical protein